MGLGGTGMLGYTARVEMATDPNMVSCLRGISRSQCCRIHCCTTRLRTRCRIPFDQNDPVPYPGLAPVHEGKLCATDQDSVLLPDISARYAVTSSPYQLLFIIIFFSFIFFSAFAIVIVVAAFLAEYKYTMVYFAPPSYVEGNS